MVEESPAASVEAPVIVKDTSDVRPKPNRQRNRRPKKAADTETAVDENGEAKLMSNKKCKYFKISGTCRFGDKCRFKHVYQPKTEEPVVEEESIQTSGEKTTLQAEQVVIMPSQPRPQRFVPTKPIRLILTSSQAGSAEQKKARDNEIAYFKRRFTGTKVTTSDDGKTSIKFTYKVLNPEWVFDVNTVTFFLIIAPEHPIACATIDIEEGLMPGPLHLYLIKKFNEIIRLKYEAQLMEDKFEPIGKWFIREIDRNILELFIVGLKRTKWLLNAQASGIKVTVFDGPGQQERELTTLEKIQASEVEGTSANQKENEQPQDDESSSSEPEESNAEVKNTAANAPIQSKATQINIVANWSDSEQSVGTICFTHFSGAARCLRCASQEFFDVASGKEQSWKCKKCSTVQSIRFESELGHQNSNVFGHVYPKGCRPVDCILLSSKLKVACMNCSKDFSVEALPYATPSQTWCRQCHAKVRFAIDSITFTGSFNAIPDGEKGVSEKQPKKKNLKDDIMLTPGQPLPKNGTCKHYGKSFRWFRFPCCGKLYPCDQCHADNEKDHEMKLANRMVCGMCSHEQPFSNESCKHCKNNVIKVRTQFWEGGKGCRDQRTMSKNDVKKYKNSNMKTIPTKRTGAVAKRSDSK